MYTNCRITRQCRVQLKQLSSSYGLICRVRKLADVSNEDTKDIERQPSVSTQFENTGGVCIVRVTFVKWAVLFQLLHYSNTCY